MVNRTWFDTLYTENYERLKKTVWRSLGSEAIAEEIVQEAFLILLCKIDEVKGHPNCSGWLTVTVKNLMKNEMKRAGTKREVSLTSEPIDEKAYTEMEKLEDVLPAGLGEDERQILILYFDKQLSYKQIAEKLKLPEGACRTRLYRAKEHVKKIMLKNKKSCDKNGSWINIWAGR